MHNSHYAGLRVVPIHQIQGSEGRRDEFDVDFRPLQERTVGRWLGIAAVQLRNAATLPPVELVQVGDVFFVRDGHHRISVARALGRVYIDAEVRVWNADQCVQQ